MVTVKGVVVGAAVLAGAAAAAAAGVGPAPDRLNLPAWGDVVGDEGPGPSDRDDRRDRSAGEGDEPADGSQPAGGEAEPDDTAGIDDHGRGPRRQDLKPPRSPRAKRSPRAENAQQAQRSDRSEVSGRQDRAAPAVAKGLEHSPAGNARGQGHGDDAAGKALEPPAHGRHKPPTN